MAERNRENIEEKFLNEKYPDLPESNPVESLVDTKAEKGSRDLSYVLEDAKTLKEVRTALLEYMESAEVSDKEHRKIAANLLGFKKLSNEQEDALLDAPALSAEAIRTAHDIDVTNIYTYFDGQSEVTSAKPRTMNFSFSEAGVSRETGEITNVVFRVTCKQVKNQAPDMFDVFITAEGYPNVIIPLRVSDRGKFVSMNTSEMDVLAKKGLYSKILAPFFRNANEIVGYIGNKETLALGADAPHAAFHANSPTAAARGKDFITMSNVAGTELTSYRVDSKLSSILQIATDFEKYKTTNSPAFIEYFHGKYEGFGKKNLVAALENYLLKADNLRTEVSEAVERQIDYLKADDFEGIPSVNVSLATERIVQRNLDLLESSKQQSDFDASKPRTAPSAIS